MAQETDAIRRIDAELRLRKDRPKSYVMDGSVGDAAHSFGYHLAPTELPADDYSLQLSRDKAGAKKNPQYASAWDLGFNPNDMKLVTGRLLAAAKAKDSRVKGIREFCGTLDGKNTFPWDLSTNTSEGIGSWDNSHLWHVHISIYRDVCNNYNALKDINDVICGVKLQTEDQVMFSIIRGALLGNQYATDALMKDHPRLVKKVGILARLSGHDKAIKTMERRIAALEKAAAKK